jgi:hypothetical protein
MMGFSIVTSFPLVGGRSENGPCLKKALKASGFLSELTIPKKYTQLKHPDCKGQQSLWSA